MAGFEFPCPCCDLTLRARDQALAGQTIECPECHSSLLIDVEGNGQLLARRQEVVSPLSTQSTEPIIEDSKSRFQRSHGFAKALPIPIVVAGFVVGFLLLFFWWGRTPEPQADSISSRQETLESEDQLPNPAQEALAENKKFEENKSLYVAQNRLIQSGLKETGTFPQPVEAPGLTVDDRFSWIATLDAHHNPDQLPPSWDRAWDDPLNEHFVRRSLSQWLNPAIDSKVSQNRYPATHFVGISGRGDDAATLPVSDPRAGLFGYERRLTKKDLKDGASNIWMLAGVQENPGAWAANGKATIRPWKGGPVVGGISGFGTAQADSMEILMADGSVRTINARTEPKVLDRLAVLNSSPTKTQNPILENVPVAKVPKKPDEKKINEWEFGAAPLTAPKPPEAAVADLLQQLQRELNVAEADQPKRDVEQQLALKLLLYDLREAQPLHKLLDQISEMADIEIVANRELLGDAAPRLDRTLTLTLIEPTLKTVLERLLYHCELGYRISDGHIEITAEPIALPPLSSDSTP